ncbi:MAG: MmgE/PrpD family protein [Paracoccaceae bacterium]
MKTSFSSALAEFAAAPTKCSQDVRRVLQLSLLDWMSVGIAGIPEPASRIVRHMILQEAGSPRSRMFGCDVKVPARAAALVNGTTSHALDYDDTHFAHIGHPSVAVFPAAVAVGELANANLQDVQDAALVGMELSIQVGLWLGRGHYQVGFHQTATAGAFGAAVASGRLLGLAPLQMEQVLGLAATRAAGLKAQFGTMGKPYNGGQAAASGVEVAQLIAAGFEANPDALDGAFGFSATHHGAADATSMNELGVTWLFEDVSHKFHACCHGLHAALEALETLKPLNADDIAAIHVSTHPRWLSVCNQPAPSTGLGAKFSYATVLPMSLLGFDTAKLESFSASTCADPDVLALRKRVSVFGDEGLTETEAVLVIKLNDGSEVTSRVDLLCPMPLEERTRRVRNKSAALIGSVKSEHLWELLQDDGDLVVLTKQMAP